MGEEVRKEDVGKVGSRQISTFIPSNCNNNSNSNSELLFFLVNSILNHIVDARTILPRFEGYCMVHKFRPNSVVNMRTLTAYALC